MFYFMLCEFHLINTIKKKALGIVLVGENHLDAMASLSLGFPACKSGSGFQRGMPGLLPGPWLVAAGVGAEEQAGRARVGGPEEPLNTLTGQRTPLSLQAGWQGDVLPVLSSGALPLPACCVTVGKAPNLSVLLFLQL